MKVLFFSQCFLLPGKLVNLAFGCLSARTQCPNRQSFLLPFLELCPKRPRFFYLRLSRDIPWKPFPEFAQIWYQAAMQRRFHFNFILSFHAPRENITMMRPEHCLTFMKSCEPCLSEGIQSVDTLITISVLLLEKAQPILRSWM